MDGNTNFHATLLLHLCAVCQPGRSARIRQGSPSQMEVERGTHTPSRLHPLSVVVGYWSYTSCLATDTRSIELGKNCSYWATPRPLALGTNPHQQRHCASVGVKGKRVTVARKN